MQLLERTPALFEASRLLHESAAAGRFLLLAGEAGVGKTSMIRRLAEMVQERAQVLVGACDPLATPRPLGPLLDVADALLPGWSSALGGEDRHPHFRRFVSELGRPGGMRVVVFEDVHWADEATLDLLRYVGRRIESMRSLLIATYRDDEVGDRHPLRTVLGDLATAAGVHRLRLLPLSVEAVGALCSGTGLDVQEVHRRTGGNPFFVTEVISSGGGELPSTVEDAVLARAARLPTAAAPLLEAAAVIGARIEPWLLEEVSLPEPGMVDACLASGLLTSQGVALAFRHELAREALLGQVAPGRRAELHRRVLAALRARPGNADLARLAHHAAEAGDAAAVLELAPEAARLAVQLGSHREAAAQYERTLAFGAALAGGARADVLEAFAQSCATLDRLPEAIAASEEALGIRRAEGDRLAEGRLLTRLASHYLGAGRNAEAEAASRTSIQVLESLPPGPELGDAYVVQSGLRMLNRDNLEAVRWGQRAIAFARQTGDERVRAGALNRVGTALLLDEHELGRGLIEEAMEIGARLGLHPLVGNSYGQLGSVAGEVYHLPLAVRYLEEGIAYCREHELLGLEHYMRAWLALALAHLGRWEEAEPIARQLTPAAGVSAISRIMALVARGRIATRRGDDEGAAILDEALELALGTGTLQRLGPVRAARAEAAWLRGDLRAVRTEAAAAYELALDHRHAWFTGELACWRVRAGESVEVPPWVARPFALQLAADWTAAAAAWQERGCAYESAAARVEAGGEEELRSALTELERLGARPLAQIAARRLREMGARSIPRGPRPSTLAHPAGLTRREVEVLRLLADGCSNARIAERLFLSPKTVGHHVSAILRKLQVPSRAAAVHQATLLGLLPR